MRIVILLSVLFALGCSQESSVSTEAEAVAEVAEAAETAATEPVVEVNPNKNAYFGDTHVHTVLSFDAYLMGTRRTKERCVRAYHQSRRSCSG